MTFDSITNKGCSKGLKNADVVTTVQCLTTGTTTPTTTTQNCPPSIALTLDSQDADFARVLAYWFPYVTGTLLFQISNDGVNYSTLLQIDNANSGYELDVSLSDYAPEDVFYLRAQVTDIGHCNDIFSNVLTVTLPAEAPCLQTVLGMVSPDIKSSVLSCFGELPAGNYIVEYVKGAIFYDATSKVFSTDSMYLNRAIDRGYRITHSTGTVIEGPMVDYAGYPSQSQVESHNAGARVAFTHTHGPICMQLVDPNGFAFHEVNGTTAPIFRLIKDCGFITTTTTTTTTVTTTTSTGTTTTLACTPCPNDTCLMCGGAQWPTDLQTRPIPDLPGYPCDYLDYVYNIILPFGNNSPSGNPTPTNHCQGIIDEVWALEIGEAVYGMSSTAMIACMSWDWASVGNEQRINVLTFTFFGRLFQCSFSGSRPQDASYCYHATYDIVRIG